MGRVLLFATNNDLAFSRRQLQQLFIEEDFEGWLERRRKIAEAMGNQLPHGPASDSRDSLTLVHRYSEEEWQKVQQLHDEA